MDSSQRCTVAGQRILPLYGLYDRAGLSPEHQQVLYEICLEEDRIRVTAQPKEAVAQSIYGTESSGPSY